jgi:hypothetical protein
MESVLLERQALEAELSSMFQRTTSQHLALPATLTAVISRSLNQVGAALAQETLMTTVMLAISHQHKQFFQPKTLEHHRLARLAHTVAHLRRTTGSSVKVSSIQS